MKATYKIGIAAGIPMVAYSSGMNYFDGLRTERDFRPTCCRLTGPLSAPICTNVLTGHEVNGFIQTGLALAETRLLLLI